MSPSSPWNEYRRRRAVCWLAMILWMPATLAAVPFSPNGLGLAAPMFVVFILGGVVVNRLGHRVLHFPCPRCLRPFFQASWYYNYFARRCLHCGLPKWSETDTSSGSTDQRPSPYTPP
jgi:hypothetical protein